MAFMLGPEPIPIPIPIFRLIGRPARPLPLLPIWFTIPMPIPPDGVGAIKADPDGRACPAPGGGGRLNPELPELLPGGGGRENELVCGTLGRFSDMLDMPAFIFPKADVAGGDIGLLMDV